LFQKKTEKEEEKVREKELEQDKRIEREMEELEERLAKKEEEEKDAAKKLLRPLTDEENDIVQEALYGNGMPTEKVATSETDSVQRKSMQTLRPCAWLNDEVIHYFLHVLSMRDEALSNRIPGRKRSHFFKSFFFTKLLDEGATNTYRYSNVKRWSKKVPGKDIFQLDKIFFVCNISGMHWTCVCAFMKEKRIQFYDSMGGSGHDYVEGVFQYFQDEWKSKHGGELPDADQWEVIGETPMGTPKQRNGYDCGVFTCMFCDFLSMDRALTFTQQHVDQCRDRIALSIMKGIAIE
jgi:sentrin-specific protease 1